MNLETPLIADIETKGFLEDLKGEESELHVLGVAYFNEGEWKVKTSNKKEDVLKVFENPNNTIVGHNFYLYDLPALEKMFKGIKIKATVIDSLLLAWYIEPNRIKEGKKYGLGDYGVEFGVPKPEIESWTDLTYEEYENRVTEDCKINTNTFFKHLKILRELYENDDERIKSLIYFLMTKGKQYKMHQDNPLRLHYKKALESRDALEGFEQEKVSVLSLAMPKVPKSVKRKKPKIMYKKSGDLTKAGERWMRLIDGCNLPEDYDGEIEEVVSYEEPNPKSNKQVKDWLFSLNWSPKIFIETTLKSGETNRVPQIKDKNKNLCPSVLKLAEKEAAIKELENLGVISHRLGIVKGFLRDCDENHNIVAGIAGLTNTMRIRHKYLVNMPKPSAPYGEYIRSLIIPQEDYIMIGADLSGLENTTRNNFIYPYDPEYVEEMNDKYYDSHLDIGVVANLITESEALFYKWFKEKKKNPNIKLEDFGKIPEDYKFIEDNYKSKEEQQEFFDKLDKIRTQAKTVNYSALYGVGDTKLSKELKIKKSEAEKLLNAFWARNWSVTKFAEDCETKKVNGQMWVKNPLNNYYYSLRTEKDIFSTVNQGVGDYIFTLWVHFLMDMGIVVQGGFHDEIITTCKPEDKEFVIECLYKAIDKVNKVLNLKIPVGIDYNVGFSYADVH